MHRRRILPPIEYDAAGTPCERVIDRQPTVFPRDVQRLFPADQALVNWGVSSYAGVPLFDETGSPIGHVAVLSRRPLDHPRQVEAVLQLFALRTAAELERRRIEARFHGIFEFSPDGIILVDEQGRIVLANQRAESLFGYTGKELLDLSIEELVPKAQRSGHAELRRGFVAAATPRLMGTGRSRLYALNKDGSVFPVDISLSPMRLDGALLVAAAVRDITEKVRSEAAHARLETQLAMARRMDALGTFASGVAHDFNTILGTITGNVELARQDVEASHPAMESLDEIRKASLRARDLVASILTFGSKLQPPQSVTALRPVAEDAVTMLRRALPAGIELVAAYDSETPTVRANPTQIHQLVTNLCTNAWQAITGDVGRVDLRLDGVVLDAETATTSVNLRPGRFARLGVTDTGRGMDAATLARIFEPFFTTKPVGQGTGLGLSVVHGIMEAHGGAVTVTSQPGTGTTFSLYFPAVEAPQPGSVAECAAAAPLPAPAGERVLYLDDEEPMVFLATRLLERLGYRVSGYSRAEEALATIHADPWQFDLVVTDLRMPGISGLDVARELARLRPDLPVVLVSGHITKKLRAAAAQAGVRELLYKPNMSKELCEVVRRLAGAPKIL